MAEVKETVTTSKDEAVDSSSGAEVKQTTRKVDTTESADGRSTAANVVWFVVGAIEILLTFRFVLKILGANPTNQFVDWIYSVSGALTAPFDSIFNVTTAEQAGSVVRSVFEPSILVAMLVYALIGWGLAKLFNINRPD